jgi:hypothetical protein
MAPSLATDGRERETTWQTGGEWFGVPAGGEWFGVPAGGEWFGVPAGGYLPSSSTFSV